MSVSACFVCFVWMILSHEKMHSKLLLIRAECTAVAAASVGGSP